MSGIFGALVRGGLGRARTNVLATRAERRGREVSGILYAGSRGYSVARSSSGAGQLAKRASVGTSDFFMGVSGLRDDLTEEQPLVGNGLAMVYSGQFVSTLVSSSKADNCSEEMIGAEEVFAFLSEGIEEGCTPIEVANRVLDRVAGALSCAVLVSASGELLVFSNTGSLYKACLEDGVIFASERHPLDLLGATSVTQVRHPEVIKVPEGKIVDTVPLSESNWGIAAPQLSYSGADERLLEYFAPDLQRCTKCILPETMPFIRFDANGVCNYCTNYKTRNRPRPKEEIFDLVQRYRRPAGDEVLVPFSGGRDSCYSLHLVVEELGLRPVTYTYDWGMVTDLGRRNVSRMSAQLGVENIVVVPDIKRKRDNIARNLSAWLKNPDLGMLSILTAGDKHFFRHVETIKKETGLNLNLWGINPLEVTHFKAGFLGVPPDFEERRVYSHGAMKQFRYQKQRTRAMVRNPGYFNRSLWDTLSGEYFRSFAAKRDYYHVFDYWRWDEHTIDETLIGKYEWETAPDTTTTWRIGDGTAAFYNYAYYTLAGFTEHDTFRSNQVREGDLERDEALRLVKEENRPRYENLKWYLDAVGIDFAAAISTINGSHRVYEV